MLVAQGDEEDGAGTRGVEPSGGGVKRIFEEIGGGKGILVAVTDEEIGTDGAEMSEINMSDSVGSVDEA